VRDGGPGSEPPPRGQVFFAIWNASSRTVSCAPPVMSI
jgi:hypothetical protein